MARVRLCVLLTAIMYFVTIMGGTASAAALPALRAFDATLTLSPTAAGQPLTATFDGTNPVIDVGGSCEAYVDKALLPATCVHTGDVLHPHWAVGFTVPANTQPGMHDVTVVANGDTASGTLEVPGPEVVVPDLHGLLYPGPAQQAAKAAGLAVCPVDRVDGIVVDQNPPPGATRNSPRCVQVTLADAVRVPNVVGDQFPVAESAVQGAKLVLSQPASTTGTVATQTPAADTVVAAGSTITVTMTDVVLVPVPNLVGGTAGDAQAVLSKVGLRLRNGGSDPGRRVRTQDPQPGVGVAPGSPVSVTLQPPDVVLVAVPDLIGRTTGDAQAVLSNVGLRLRNGGSDPRRRVETQDPQPGVNVAPGSPVSVTLQPPHVVLVTVPDLGGMTVDQARAALSTAKLAFGNPAGNAADNAHVVGQSPVGGARVRPGTTVTVSLEVPASSTNVGVPGVPLALVLAAALGIVLVRRLRPGALRGRKTRRGNQKARRSAVHLVPRPDPAVEVRVLSSSDLPGARIGLAPHIDATTEPDLFEVPR